MECQIRAWLKAGILLDGYITPAEEGTPQGGVISPLLSNIALHGMENALMRWVEKIPVRDERGRSLSKTSKLTGLTIVRYADDFVVLHKDREVVEGAMGLMERWLKEIGLELKDSKTFTY